MFCAFLCRLPKKTLLEEMNDAFVVIISPKSATDPWELGHMRATAQPKPSPTPGDHQPVIPPAISITLAAF